MLSLHSLQAQEYIDLCSNAYSPLCHHIEVKSIRWRKKRQTKGIIAQLTPTKATLLTQPQQRAALPDDRMDNPCAFHTTTARKAIFR